MQARQGFGEHWRGSAARGCATVPDDEDGPADHAPVINPRNPVRPRKIGFNSAHLHFRQQKQIESRLALIVTRPEAFVSGDLSASTSSNRQRLILSNPLPKSYCGVISYVYAEVDMD